jgi:hypothetical protein
MVWDYSIKKNENGAPEWIDGMCGEIILSAAASGMVKQP